MTEATPPEAAPQVSPTQVSDMVKLFAPLVLGAVFLVLGIIRSDGALVAMGAGLLGIPGLTGTLTAHRQELKGAQSIVVTPVNGSAGK
jgi:hypothetical protein